MKTEAWANTLAERLVEVKAETIGETLTANKTLTVNKTLGDVEAEELVDTLANTLLEDVAKRNPTH